MSGPNIHPTPLKAAAKLMRWAEVDSLPMDVA